jgi:cytoskeletal protein CcmA (bactofilin family)
MMEKVMNQSQGKGTLVGARTVVRGNLQGDEDLTVVGRVDGTIALSKTLIVEPDGVVVADVQVQRAMISGTVVGNITATDLIHLTETGRVVGDLAAPRVVLVEGAAFRGNVEMGDLEAPRVERPRTAVVSTPARPRAPVPTPRASAPAAPRPAPPPRRVREERAPERETTTKPAAPKPAPARPAPRPSLTAEPPREAPTTRSGDSLQRRAEAAAQAVAGRSTPRPKEAELGLMTTERGREVSSTPASKGPPKPPTTAGKKARVRRK